jgi:beta-aspartyl-peptidase (threonine type)
MPVLVGSANALVGMPAGIAVLRDGGSALDAVEVVIRAVEDDPADCSVGYGGLPNLLGEVELDASIMEGATRRAGAVGSVTRRRNPITLARAVMERLPHVMLVGDGTRLLAEELGIPEAPVLSEDAHAEWVKALGGRAPDEIIAAGPSSLVAVTADPEHVAGTVNVIARDASGHIASGASTSGWAWKYPGRLGDTPQIGAGNYCDDRAGAATCTGLGELSIRAGTARMAVAALARGDRPDVVARDAVAEAASLAGGGECVMHVVVLSACGAHAAASTDPAWEYCVWEDGMSDAELRPRAWVRVSRRAAEPPEKSATRT